MLDANMIVRERQLAIRREMDRRGISLKQVHFDSGIPYATVVSYFPGERDRQPATVPMSAVYLMAEKRAVPLDLLSLLMPAGVLLVEAPEQLDHDQVEEAARAYLAEKGDAHRSDSEAGREIGPNEATRLTAKATHLKAVA